MLNSFLGSEGVRIIKFSLVAIIRTIIDLIVWKILAILIDKNKFLKPSVEKIKLSSDSFAHGVSTIVSIVISYFANKIFVFTSNSNISEFEEVFRFTVVSVVALVTSTILMQIIFANPSFNSPKKWHPLLAKYWSLVCKILAIGVTMIINYAGLRFWTFA